MPYPKMIKIKQKFSAIPAIRNIEQMVRDQLSEPGLMSAVKPGDSVAITAGSRGVANIHIILKTVVEELKAIGASPFIIPAMGSHGKATAEGQIEVLEHYKVTEEIVGAPIKSSMETVQLGNCRDGFMVYMDKNAYEADHVVVVNRIKQHTDFCGKIESGLVKIIGIGLGKRDGAASYHGASLHYGFERVLRGVAEIVLNTGKIAFGLGIIENQYDETAVISSVHGNTLVEEEERLQEKAKEMAAHLPFDELDVLIVDEIGKDISGAGMDTKIIGRLMHTGGEDLEKPKITRIFARDITPNSMGNAGGIGLADFTTTRLVNKMDREATYINFITAMGPQKVRIPVYYDTDREVLDAVFQTIGMVKPEESRTVRIKNTLELALVEVSEKFLDAVKERDDLEIAGKLKEMEFDSAGNLTPLHVAES